MRTYVFSTRAIGHPRYVVCFLFFLFFFGRGNGSFSYHVGVHSPVLKTPSWRQGKLVLSLTRNGLLPLERAFLHKVVSSADGDPKGLSMFCFEFPAIAMAVQREISKHLIPSESSCIPGLPIHARDSMANMDSSPKVHFHRQVNDITSFGTSDTDPILSYSHHPASTPMCSRSRYPGSKSSRVSQKSGKSRPSLPPLTPLLPRRRILKKWKEMI